MAKKEKRIAKTKGGNTRRLAKSGTKLRIGATKRGIGPAGGAPVSKATGKVFTAKGGALFSGQSKGYPKTLDIRYEKDLAMKKKMKNKKTTKKVSSRL